MTVVLLSIVIFLIVLISYYKKRKRSGAVAVISTVEHAEAGSSTSSVLSASLFPEANSFYNIPITYDNISVVLNEVRIRDNGIFVIVRKNRSGYIIGSYDDILWRQIKLDRERRLKNPIREARLHVYAFSKTLRSIGVHDWVQGVVLFENPHVELNIGGEFPVLKEADLEEYLDSYGVSRKTSEESKIKAIALVTEKLGRNTSFLEQCNTRGGE